MFCTKCGLKLDDDTIFCPGCGEKVQEHEISRENTYNHQGTGYVGAREPNYINQGDMSISNDKYSSDNSANANNAIFQGGVNYYSPNIQQPSTPTTGVSKKKIYLAFSVIGVCVIVIAVLATLLVVTMKGKKQTESVTSQEIEDIASKDDMVNYSGNQENPDDIITPALTLSPSPEPTSTIIPTPTQIPLPAVVMELQNTLTDLNGPETTLQGISVYEINCKPSIHSYSETWDRNIMYSIEDLASTSMDGYATVNECDIQKKEFVNIENGQIIDYEIYINPSNSKVHKIVSIEYMGDHLEITDYYYDLSGNVNFIFQRDSDTYQPTYATPDKIGNRYYFKNDSMVAWRKVTEDKTTNYVIGQNEYKRQEKEGRNNLKLYSSLNEDGKKIYDTLEEKMLNAAYNTYRIVLSADGVSVVQGFVYDTNGNAFANAQVSLYLSKENDLEDNYLVFETMTDKNGLYNIKLPVRTYSYYVEVTYRDYNITTLYDVNISNEDIGMYQPSIYLTQSDNNVYEVNLRLADALNYQDSSHVSMLPLSNAEVLFRNGVNNRKGEIVETGYSDSNGYLSVKLNQGMYTIQIISDGYEVLYYNIVSNGQGNLIAINVLPELGNNELAIVLTWNDTPSDLDSHLFDPNDSSGHIWYGVPRNRYGASLDVDVRSGYGPETVTIMNLTNGLYKYYVADFSNCSSRNTTSTEMSYSDATVNIYSSEGLLQTFHVPTNKAGVIWEVFEIRNRRIIPIQRYYSNIQDKSWWNSAK